MARSSGFSAVAAVLVVLGSGWLSAAEITVDPGGGGDYLTIQAAVNAAVPGVDTRIDVAVGTYNENVAITPGWTSGFLVIQGGWASDFASQSLDPSLTTINGGGAGPVVLVNSAGGVVRIEYFTITNGLAQSGAGIGIGPTGNASVEIQHNRILGNTATLAGSAYGGGIFAGISGSQQLTVIDCNIKQNTVETTSTSTSDEALGGGVYVAASESSSFYMQDCEVHENEAKGVNSNRKDAGGLAAFLSVSASGQLLDTDISDNTLSGPPEPDPALRASGAWVGVAGDSDMVMRRVSLAANSVSEGSGSFQLRANSGGTVQFRATELGIVSGDDGGAQLEGNTNGSLSLSNLTVADNTGIGLELLEFDSSTVSLYNSIVYDNGTETNFTGSVDSIANLIGVDPLFVDAANWDYHLRIGSPAEDQGNNSPPGDLGPTDFEGNPRVLNGTVDIGIYEGIAEIFSDGFESGDTGEW